VLPSDVQFSGDDLKAGCGAAALAVCRRDGDILYVNPVANDFFREREGSLRSHLRGFRAKRLVGGNIFKLFAALGAGDIDARKLLRSRELELDIGGTQFLARLDPITGSTGGGPALVVEWRAVDAGVGNGLSLETVLRTVLSGVSQGIAVYDAQEKLVACNPQFSTVLDYPSDLLKPGITREDITRFRAERGDFGEGDVDRLVAARVSRPPLGRIIERNLASGRAYIHERVSLPGGGFISIATDVTDRNQIQKKLAEQSRVLETALEYMSHGIAVFNAEHKLVAFNQKCVELRDYPPGFLKLGVSPEDLYRYKAERGYYGPGNSEEHVSLRMRARAQSRSGRIERTRADGRVVAINHAAMPDGGWVATYTDITHSKAVAQKSEELSAKLHESQKMQAIGQLAGGVAHDFNNILMVIQGYASAARKNALVPEEARDHLDQVLLAVNKAAGVTKQLLAFGRRQVLETRVVQASTILRDLESLLRPLLGETIHLRFEVGEDDLSIATDPAQLTQAIINLAINARDALPTGGAIGISMEPYESDHRFLARNSEVSPGSYMRINVEDTWTKKRWGPFSSRSLPPRIRAKEPGWGLPWFTGSSVNPRVPSKSTASWAAAPSSASTCRSPTSRLRCSPPMSTVIFRLVEKRFCWPRTTRV
jgi:PAS domain-containing protein